MVKRDISRLVYFLIDAIGPDYGVAFYKLNENNKGITAAARYEKDNSGVTVGSPMPSDIQRMVDEGIFEKNPYCTDMTTIYSNGMIANTSMIYFDGTDSIEKGILCIDLFENKYFDLIQELLYISNLDKKLTVARNLESGLQGREVIRIESPKEESEDKEAGIRLRMEAVIKDVVKKHMGVYANDESKFTPKIRRAIIEELYQKGVFSIKGINGSVAKALFCAEVSVYRHLSCIRKDS